MTPTVPRTPRAGLALAATTALVSGVAVFVNGYGATRFSSPTVYTTAKNLVASVLLGTVLVGATRRRSGAGWTAPRGAGSWLGLLAVGIVGGGIAFVLFFEGLASASSTDAAFLHKTMVVWVALLAPMVLRERTGTVQAGAIGMLVAGQAVLVRDPFDLRPGRGELLVLAATLLWSVEVVVARRLLRDLSPLTVGTARLGVGLAVLVGWCAATGQAGDLAGLGADGWRWALLTGGLLTAYVTSWYAALARAAAVDVTAVLVGGALLTALLDAAVEGTALVPQIAGLVLVAAGVLLAAGAATRPSGRRLAPQAAG